MNNYKTKAKYWKSKLMRTPAGYVSLAAYRFKKWQEYRKLSRQDAMNHLRGESDE